MVAFSMYEFEAMGVQKLRDRRAEVVRGGLQDHAVRSSQRLCCPAQHEGLRALHVDLQEIDMLISCSIDMSSSLLTRTRSDLDAASNALKLDETV